MGKILLFISIFILLGILASIIFSQMAMTTTGLESTVVNNYTQTMEKADNIKYKLENRGNPQMPDDLK